MAARKNRPAKTDIGLGQPTAEMSEKVTNWLPPYALTQPPPRQIKIGSIFWLLLILPFLPMAMPAILFPQTAYYDLDIISRYCFIFIPSLVLLGFSVYLLKAHLRTRKLLAWGQVAPVKIIDKREYYLRSNPVVDVTFQFVDANGRLITGTSKSIFNYMDLFENIPGTFSEITENPTVLYQIENSTNNYLYRTSSIKVLNYKSF